MCEPGGNRLGEPGLCPRRREQPPPWFLRWPPASRPPPPAARFAALGLDPGVQRERAAAGAVRRTGPPASLQDAAWHGSPDISTLAADRTFLSGCNSTCTRQVRMSSLSNIEMSASFDGEREADIGLGGDERARCAANSRALRGSWWAADSGVGSYIAGCHTASGAPFAGPPAGWRWRCDRAPSARPSVQSPDRA